MLRKNAKAFDQPDDCEMSGSVIAQLWKRKSKLGRYYWTITFARWKTDGKKMYVTKYLYRSDLDDLIEVCLLLKERMKN